MISHRICQHDDNKTKRKNVVTHGNPEVPNHAVLIPHGANDLKRAIKGVETMMDLQLRAKMVVVSVVSRWVNDYINSQHRI